MDKRTLILVVSVLVLIIVGMFIYTYLKRTEVRQNSVILDGEVSEAFIQ